jgi:ABC transporter, phosphonate, periplasmic substrate-binding protein
MSRFWRFGRSGSGFEKRTEDRAWGSGRCYAYFSRMESSRVTLLGRYSPSQRLVRRLLEAWIQGPCMSKAEPRTKLSGAFLGLILVAWSANCLADDEVGSIKLEASGKVHELQSTHKQARIIRPLSEDQPIALTDLKDQVVQTGLIVVRKDDPAKSVDDLKGYRILFIPADCDEKSAAPVELLRKHGIQLPDELETSPSCSNAAVALMEMSATTKAAAVISSYAELLLEGCGKLKKGDLRVIGGSKPVPSLPSSLVPHCPRQSCQSFQMRWTRLAWMAWAA